MTNFAVQILGPVRDDLELIGEIDFRAPDELEAVAIANGTPVPPGGHVLLFEKDARTGTLTRLVREFAWSGAPD